LSCLYGFLDYFSTKMPQKTALTADRAHFSEKL
jgi:hypothetical protein